MGPTFLSQLEQVLMRWPDLRVQPQENAGAVELCGTLDFTAIHAGCPEIADAYELSIQFPIEFPEALPQVREIGGRVPKTFHTNPDGTLCLGTDFRLKMIARQVSGAVAYLERVVVSYLYSYSHLIQFGRLPYGDLSHGDQGEIEDLLSYLEVNQATIAAELLKATQGIGAPLSLHFPCPCGSKAPLPSCHGAKIGKLREVLSREELSILSMALATKVEGGRRLNRLSLLNSSVLIASREVDFARLYYMQRNRSGWKQRPAK